MTRKIHLYVETPLRSPDAGGYRQALSKLKSAMIPINGRGQINWFLYKHFRDWEISRVLFFSLSVFSTFLHLDNETPGGGDARGSRTIFELKRED